MTNTHDPATPQGENASTNSSEKQVPEANSPTAPAERPRPAFGEYAPDGWSWQATASPEIAGQGQAPADPVTQSAPGTQHFAPKTVAGVPHNLGVGQQRSGSTPPVTPPETHPASSPPAVTQSKAGPELAPAKPQKRRKGDRIATIALLVLGAFGTLNLASAFAMLPQTFVIMAEAFEITDWTTPASISTIGTIGTFMMLGLYAVVLIYSVQRMRGGKLAFLVPLIGGVITLVIMMVIMAIALSQAPELLADTSPERVQKALDLISQQQQ
jgi:hypothetical protein